MKNTLTGIRKVNVCHKPSIIRPSIVCADCTYHLNSLEHCLLHHRPVNHDCKFYEPCRIDQLLESIDNKSCPMIDGPCTNSIRNCENCPQYHLTSEDLNYFYK